MRWMGVDDIWGRNDTPNNATYMRRGGVGVGVGY